MNIVVAKPNYMDKVTQSDKNTTPYGGLNFIYEAVSCAGLDKFLDAQIGCRSLIAKYSYSDVVLSLLGNSLVQGSFISDLQTLERCFDNLNKHEVNFPILELMRLLTNKRNLFCEDWKLYRESYCSTLESSIVLTS